MRDRAAHAAAAVDLLAARASVIGAQETLADAVAEFRRAGASWTDVGRVLGTTRQAAWERWHKLEDCPHSVT